MESRVSFDVCDASGPKASVKMKLGANLWATVEASGMLEVSGKIKNEEQAKKLHVSLPRALGPPPRCRLAAHSGVRVRYAVGLPRQLWGVAGWTWGAGRFARSVTWGYV